MISVHVYHEQSIGVFGLGKAGKAAIEALQSGGAKVYAWDDNLETSAKMKALFPDAEITPPEIWQWPVLKGLVLSPGVPLTHPEPHPVVKLAHQHACPVIGEVELLHLACPQAKKIGITGTNGKSTTTSLVGHLLQQAGRKAEMGGNLGTPALALRPLGKDGCYVLELSSYQLELMHTAKFDISVLLNITPDHIDRHGSMEGYVNAKRKIFDRQGSADVAVIAVDDPLSSEIFRELQTTHPGRIIAVSANKPLKQGVYVDKGILHDCLNGSPALWNLNPISTLTGRHNWQNAAAAYAVARSYGLAPETIGKLMATFPGLRHRMELAAMVGDVRFINDSKATNADATANALASYDTIYWIAGGRAKEGGIESLSEFFPRIVRGYLVGEAADAFSHTLENKVQYTQCGSLENAVFAAAEDALREKKKNAVVLLSPACASFDQWKNFEERGDAFCTYAKQFQHQQKKVV